MATFSILCIGDSHTAGFPAYDPIMGGNPASSYQYWLKKGLHQSLPQTSVHLVNQGLCGDSSCGIVNRLRDTLEKQTFDLVILAGGTNDLGMISEELIIKNLQEGFKVCGEHRVPVIAAGMPPVSLQEYVAKITAVNHAIAASAEKFDGFLFVDWFGALKDKQGFLDQKYNSGDGVHLSVAGYQSIGMLLVPAVKRCMPG